MAKAKSDVSFEIDKGALLAHITGSRQYQERLLADGARRAVELQQVGTAFYQAALEATNEIFQAGVKNAASPRQQVKVRLPNGRQVVVGVDWDPLTPKWRKDKARRARANYKGEHRSAGAGLFWLDEGKLREAFAAWMPGRGTVDVDKPRLRQAGKNQYRVSYRLNFKRLGPAFLDIALRRALIAGAVAGRRVVALEDLTGPDTVSRRGVWRAFWPEAYRPTMRPLAMRLGRAMQEQILKTLTRR